MRVAVYHLPIDWRRAKFYLDHPDCRPEPEQPASEARFPQSYFLPLSAIGNVLSIRDWLYRATLLGHYFLYGCYEAITSVFQGLVFVFEYASDLLRFHAYCQDRYGV